MPWRVGRHTPNYELFIKRHDLDLDIFSWFLAMEELRDQLNTIHPVCKFLLLRQTPKVLHILLCRLYRLVAVTRFGLVPASAFLMDCRLDRHHGPLFFCSWFLVLGELHDQLNIVHLICRFLLLRQFFLLGLSKHRHFVLVSLMVAWVDMALYSPLLNRWMGGVSPHPNHFIKLGK